LQFDAVMVQLEGAGRSDNPNVTMNLAEYYLIYLKRSLIFIVLAAVLIGLVIDISAGIENHNDRVLDAANQRVNPK
jgi:hypothetical protein